LAGYNDPESGYVNGSLGFFTHLSHLTDITNKFDKDVTPNVGDVPTWNGSVYAPAAGPAASSGAAGVVNVDDYGAAHNGTTDDSAAVINARNAVLNSRTSGIPTKPILQFGPGVYRIASPDALLPINSTLIYGYTIRGTGQRTTRILFDPSGGSSTLTNMNLMTAAGTGGTKLFGLKIEDIQFESTNANASFGYFYSTATSWVQNTQVRRVRFTGPWKYVFALDGDSAANLNSEMTFDSVSTSGATFSQAFLYSGITSPSTNSQQDQFLNYWFRDCKMEHASGDALVFARGGFITIEGGSWIMTDAAGGTFFKMPGNYSRADSVQWLSVRGARFELRNANTRLIDCEWRHGAVSFINCSDASHGFNYQINGSGGGLTNYDTHIYRPSNNTMPTIRYQDCELMGYHRIVTSGTIPSPGKVIYDGCTFKNMQAGGVSLLSTATNQFLRYDSAVPKYRFIDCRGVTDANN
jgi:hypothetical protein